jgi:hypothetical protein
MNSKLKDSTNRVIRNKRGFSIVGVLVAATLMGLIAIGFSTMMTNSKKAQTGVQNSIDFDIMRASVMQVLANSDLCKDAFFARNGTSRAKLNPASPPPVNQQLHSIKVGPSTVVAKNQKLGGGLEITKLEFQQVTGTAPNYQAFLYIEGSRSTGGFGGTQISNASNRPLVSLRTNSRDAIVGCKKSSGAFTDYTSTTNHTSTVFIPTDHTACFIAGFGSNRENHSCRVNKEASGGWRIVRNFGDDGGRLCTVRCIDF